MTRRTMPGERAGRTFKFIINGSGADGPAKHKGYLTVNTFADGTVGEIFVRLDKQGSTVGGFVDAWAIAVSMLLQRGVPLEDVIAKFRGSRFEPAGMTDTAGIPFCSSPVDLICKILAIKFLKTETP